MFAPVAASGSTTGDPVHSAANHVVDLLLVEDDPMDIELTLEAFKAAKLSNRVHITRNGVMALDFLFCQGKYANRQAENRPQVVLLDLNLPGLHGLEVLRRIKADKRTRTIQVVILTVSRNDEHIREAMELGADAYIVKPVDFQNFSEVTPKLSFEWTLRQPKAVVWR
jgi:two-component system response regulator